ncbi:MAG: helix-turn-helix domain-containing protein [Candidatus Parvarchaeota archaeon]
MKFYEPENFSYIHFQISHEDCWTNNAKKYKIEISTLYTKSDPYHDNIYGIVELKARHRASLKDFIKDIRRSESIHSIDSVSIVDIKANLFKMEINERFLNMVSGILYNFPIIFRSDLVANGIENETIIVGERYVSDIEKELNKLGDLKLFRVIRVDIGDLLNSTITLTSQERFAISKALEGGYYDIPKKLHLGDLSEKTGLSKATLEEYIRKAEMKIMRKMKLWLLQS